MQIYIFMKAVKEMGPGKQKFVSATRYYRKCYILDVSHIFAYYVHSVHFGAP